MPVLDNEIYIFNINDEDKEKKKEAEIFREFLSTNQKQELLEN